MNVTPPWTFSCITAEQHIKLQLLTKQGHSLLRINHTSASLNLTWKRKLDSTKRGNKRRQRLPNPADRGMSKDWIKTVSRANLKLIKSAFCTIMPMASKLTKIETYFFSRWLWNCTFSSRKNWFLTIKSNKIHFLVRLTGMLSAFTSQRIGVNPSLFSFKTN